MKLHVVLWHRHLGLACPGPLETKLGATIIYHLLVLPRRFAPEQRFLEQLRAKNKTLDCCRNLSADTAECFAK